MRNLLSILLSFVCSFSLYGQTNTAETTKQINKIKLSKEYITAESTAETSEKSYENARALLELNIEEWIKSTKHSGYIQGYIAKSSNKILKLDTMRGNRYRTLLYVKKSDVMTYTEPTDIIVAPVQKDIYTSTSSAGSSNGEYEKSISEQLSASASKYQPNDEERRMLLVDRLPAIESFIEQSSDIAAYGKFKDMPQLGECYLFIYNREGNVPAVLLRNSEGYTNVSSGKQDDINNYKGCGAIWFQYK